MKQHGFAHESQNNASVDWYTPPWIFERMGIEFDLDPCQPKNPIEWIPAKSRYTIEDDGLKSEWFGRVWLNPPYGKHTSDWHFKNGRTQKWNRFSFCAYRLRLVP